MLAKFIQEPTFPDQKVQVETMGYAYMMPKVAYPSFTQTMVHLM